MLLRYAFRFLRVTNLVQIQGRKICAKTTLKQTENLKKKKRKKNNKKKKNRVATKHSDSKSAEKD